MQHYEIIFMIHPDQTLHQVDKIIKNYRKFIFKNHGIIHRLENWGRRQLAYPINKLHKSYYVLMNIEIYSKYINILEEKFRFDEHILRKIIILMKEKITSISPILKLKDDKLDKK